MLLSFRPKSNNDVHEAVRSVFSLLPLFAMMILVATSTSSPTVSSSSWSSSAPFTHTSTSSSFFCSLTGLHTGLPTGRVVEEVVAPVPFTDGITQAVASSFEHTHEEDAAFDILVVALEIPAPSDDAVNNPLLRCYSVPDCTRAAAAAAATARASSSIPVEEDEKEQQPPSDANKFWDWLFQRLFDCIGRAMRWSLLQCGRSGRWWLHGCARWSYHVSQVGLRFVWTHKAAIVSGGCRVVQFHVRLWWHNKGLVCAGLYRSTIFLAKLLRHNLGFLGSGLVAVVSFVVRLAWHNHGLLGTWLLPGALLCWGLSVLVPWSLRTIRSIRGSLVRMFYRFLHFVVRSVMCCCCAVVLFFVLRL